MIQNPAAIAVKSTAPPMDAGTAEYRETFTAMLEASGKLNQTMSEEQREIFEVYQNTRTDTAVLIQIGVFRQGVKFGFDLAKELAQNEIDNDDRSLKAKE